MVFGIGPKALSASSVVPVRLKWLKPLRFWSSSVFAIVSQPLECTGQGNQQVIPQRHGIAVRIAAAKGADADATLTPSISRRPLPSHVSRRFAQTPGANLHKPRR